MFPMRLAEMANERERERERMFPEVLVEIFEKCWLCVITKKMN